MTITQHQLQVTKNARYNRLGKPEARHLIYVLHGYAQLSTYFIQKFEDIANLGYCVIAPEGLHRFYLKGASGRVGASWMTKEDRESDIQDNMAYLNQLHLEISSNQHYETVTVLGFSQGGATAARWLGSSPFTFTKLILWACIFPPDMEKDLKIKQPNLKTFFVIGDQDEFFQGKEQDDMRNYYSEMNFSVILYRGSHQIISRTLIEVVHL